MGYTKRYRKTYKKHRRAKKPTLSGNVHIPFINKNLSFNLMKRSIQQIVDDDKECKRKLISQTLNLTHHGHYNRNILGNIPIGSTSLHREADEIKLCNLKGSIMVRAVTSATGFETYFRLMLIRTKKEVSFGTDLWSSAVGTTDLYINDSFASNAVNSILDPKKVQALYDKTYKMPFTNGATPNTGTINIPFNIPLNLDYVYKTGYNNGNKYNLHWVMISTTPGGTEGTTVTLNVAEDSQLLFKDK